jgi:HlyD family type I secretion membrane fusion protein
MTDTHRPSHDIRRVVTVGLAVIFLTFGVIGVWAAVVPLSSAVIGHGAVELETSRQMVQHYEGGIIRAILVHEGDHVRAGQELVELNPVQADAALESARNELFSLLCRGDRLIAERDNRAAVNFSQEVLAQQSNPVVARAMADETLQFHVRRAALNAAIAVLQSRITQFKTQIQGIDEQRVGMQQQVALLDDELSGLNDLYQKDLVPKPRLLELQRSRAQLEGEIGAAVADKAKAEESIGETQLQINQAHQQFYEEVSKELAEVQTQSADYRQRFAVAQDAARRVSLFSPVDGVVQNLRVSTVGGVVRPGDPIMEIAPDRGRMLIDARFSPNDVDSLRQGQTVQVRFVTFHSRTLPVIEGTVRSISQDRLSDEATHQAYYLAVIDVPSDHLPPQLQGRLRAGLPVEVIATTGSRTALQYMLKPLGDALTGAMRER